MAIAFIGAGASSRGQPRLQQWPPQSYGPVPVRVPIIRRMLLALPPATFMMRLLGREDRPQRVSAGIKRLLAVGLRAGKLQELPMGRGRMVVHCRSGEVWITHDGDPRDVVLRQDQSYVVDRPARMTAFALRGDCGLELQQDL